MLENYLDIITNIENYVDGIIVTDKNANIIYIHKYWPNLMPLPEKDMIGKNLFQVYPSMSPHNSTIMKALKTGEVTLNNQDTLTTSEGQSFKMVDDTFPIKENGLIIGAVCITHSLSRKQTLSMLDISTGEDHFVKNLFSTADIIGRSESIQVLRQQIHKVAQTSSSLLIYGDTGTGKEMLAQSVHSGSSRKSKPFITQNCAAIPATLLENIFFGAVKGSYTGAENHAGIFEMADGGTVFLDEINSMDIGLQAKLLRVLEEKKVTRIGSAESINVDVRIIAAINRPPLECIENGTLRADLFYRLGSVTLTIPLLKDRADDIDLLTKFFIDKYKVAMGKNIIGVSQDVMTVFQNYSWPGNVRELKNVIEGAFNLCDSTVIGLGDLPSYMLSGMEVKKLVAENQADIKDIQWLGSLKNNIEAYEKTLITNAIKSHKNLSQAASYLGISRQSLNQKINKYKISVVRNSFVIED